MKIMARRRQTHSGRRLSWARLNSTSRRSITEQRTICLPCLILFDMEGAVQSRSPLRRRRRSSRKRAAIPETLRQGDGTMEKSGEIHEEAAQGGGLKCPRRLDRVYPNKSGARYCGNPAHGGAVNDLGQSRTIRLRLLPDHSRPEFVVFFLKYMKFSVKKRHRRNANSLGICSCRMIRCCLK